MKTLRKISLLFIGVTLSMLSFAQPPHEGGPHGDNKERQEKIKALKVEYLTTQLELSPEEAQKFWPIYNEFEEKMRTLEKSRRKSLKASEGKQLTDKEVNALIQMNFDTDQDILDLRKEYDLKFKKALSVQKVGKLYKAEKDFRHELLRKMKRGGGPPH